MKDQEKIIAEAVQKEIDKRKKNSITRYQFYFETALYEPVFCENYDTELFDGVVDAYNSMDGFDTTYSIRESVVDSYVWVGFRKINLSCKRDGKTALKFFVVVFDDGSLMKIGQHPSLADIQFAEIGQKYKKHLSEIDLKNYKKSIGLYAHGAGAGSFVYLRRIFENLILETYQKHKEEIEVKENDFQKKWMEEKVEVLKTFLPSQLLEMKSIYGILSKGVHELSEEECLNYFSPIKLSIILILDQKIEKAEKENKDKLVKKELQIINQNINGKKSFVDNKKNDKQ